MSGRRGRSNRDSWPSLDGLGVREPARLVVLGLLVLIGAASLWVGTPDADGEPACGTTYTGAGTDDSFSTAANWSSGVPRGAVHGCLPTGVTTRVTANETIGGLTIEAGSVVTVEARLTTSASATPDAGIINRGSIVINGSGFIGFTLGSGTTLTNAGDVTFATAASVNGNGGTLLNEPNGSITIDPGVTLSLSLTTFTNQGTITDNGRIQPNQIGSLNLETGSSLSGTGILRFENASSSTFNWNGGSIDLDGEFISGSSLSVFIGGGTGAITFDAFSTLSGNLNADQRVNVEGPIQLGSVFVNDGEFRIGGGQLQMNGNDLTNTGLISSVSGSGSVFAGGATLLHEAGGTIRVDPGTQLTLVSDMNFQAFGETIANGTFTLLNNNGLMVQFHEGSTLRGTGAAEMIGGELAVTGGSIDVHGTLVVSSNATIELNGQGSTDITSRGAKVQGTVGPSQTLRFEGGSNQINGDVVNQGSLFLNPTFFNANGFAVTNQNILAATGAGVARLFNGSLINEANALIGIDSGATLRIEGTGANVSRFDNFGTIAVAGTLDNDNDNVIVTTGSATGSGTLDNDGELRGTGTFDIVIDAANGEVFPGQSPGVLDVASLTLNGGSTTDIELGGVDPGDFDQINATGPATLGGTMNVSIVNGYVPQVCDSFDVITGDPVTGNFSNITGTNLGGGLQLVPFQQADRFSLVVTDTGSPISLAPTAVSVTEGGNTDEYTLCLASNPTSAVTVSADDSAGQVTTAPEPATFLPGDPLVQVVTVTAVDDTDIEASPHTSTIESTVTSADLNFDGASLPDVTASIDDNDGAPIAIDDSASMQEDDSVLIDLTANDDPNGSDLDEINIESFPANGDLITDATTVVRYDPDPNFNGTDSFEYTVESSSNAQSNVATVTVTVTPINDPPVANPDSAKTDERTSVVIDVVANDSDVDVGDVLTVADSDSTSRQGGRTTITADGRVRYAPPPVATSGAGRAFTGVDTFTYTVSDGNGAFDQGTVQVSVSATGGSSPPVAPPAPPPSTTTTTTPAPQAPSAVANTNDPSPNAPSGSDEEAAGPLLPPDEPEPPPDEDPDEFGDPDLNTIVAVPRGVPLEIAGDATGCDAVTVTDADGDVIATGDVTDDRFAVSVPTLDFELGILDITVTCDVDGAGLDDSDNADDPTADPDNAGGADGRVLSIAPVAISQPQGTGPGPGRPGILVVIVIAIMAAVSQFIGTPPPAADLDIIYKDSDDMSGGQLQAYKEAAERRKR